MIVAIAKTMPIDTG